MSLYKGTKKILGDNIEVNDKVVSNTTSWSSQKLIDQDYQNKEQVLAAVKSASGGGTTVITSAGNAGDIPILPLDTSCNAISVLCNSAMPVNEIADNVPGGFIFSGQQEHYRNKMFNRIKIMVGTPGWVRIGIVRGTGTEATNIGLLRTDGVPRGILKAGARYDDEDVYPESLTILENDTTADGQSHTTLRKWLVVQYAATTGLHIYDFEDTIITSPFEYIYVESRKGTCGFYINLTGAERDYGTTKVANGTSNNALAWPTGFISESAPHPGEYAVSNNMLSCSHRFGFLGTPNNGQGQPCRWTDISYNQNDIKNFNLVEHNGSLNLGLYQRGDSGNKYFEPVVENCISRSSPSTDLNKTSCIIGWGPRQEYQDKLVGKKVYAIEMIVTNPGDMSVFVFSSTDPATCRILKHYTLRIRAIGRQLIHLPDDIILESGQWIGIFGVTKAVSYNRPVEEVMFDGNKINTGYADTARFAYAIPDVLNWECKGDDPSGIQTLYPYDSFLEGPCPTGFQMWTGVKYIPGEKAGEGHFDFTKATLGSDPQNYLNICFVTRTDPISSLEDLYCSITGDSISTYDGVCSRKNDFGVPVNNAGNNAIEYPASNKGLTSGLDSTWWGALIRQTRMRLLRNDAWSGSKCSGTESDTSSTACASVVRTKNLQNVTCPSYTPVTTADALTHPFGTPDIVFCMIGTNDLAGNIDAGDMSNTTLVYNTIIGAFQTMINNHRTAYPNTRFVYFMIPRGSTFMPYTNGKGYSIAQMAADMERVAKAMGCYFVPLNYFSKLSQQTACLWSMTGGYTDYQTVTVGGAVTYDYLHPTALGHQIIADALQRYCESHVL